MYFSITLYSRGADKEFSIVPGRSIKVSDEVAEWRPQLDGGIVEGVCGKQKAPWGNTTVANQRRECRKAEQKWKKKLNFRLTMTFLKERLCYPIHSGE